MYGIHCATGDKSCQVAVAALGTLNTAPRQEPRVRLVRIDFSLSRIPGPPWGATKEIPRLYSTD